MYTINKLIATLLTVGGVGYINFYTLLHMGLIQTAKENEKHIVPICLIFSLFDFAIYICLQQWLAKIPQLSVKTNANWLTFWTVLLTMLLSFLLTLLLGRIGVKIFYWLTNKTRTQHNQATLVQDAPFEEIMSSSKPAVAYLYDFSHTELGWGYIFSASGDENSHYQLNLSPVAENKEINQPSYESLTGLISTKSYQEKHTIYQHVNFKQQFIMIVIEDNN